MPNDDDQDTPVPTPSYSGYEIKLPTSTRSRTTENETPTCQTRVMIVSKRPVRSQRLKDQCLDTLAISRTAVTLNFIPAGDTFVLFSVASKDPYEKVTPFGSKLE
jgi:hypothetical protein